ncbi:MAG TPA: cupredoxin domain-containing protein [Steroidobacteraceae bacterium]|jgi:amicyanin
MCGIALAHSGHAAAATSVAHAAQSSITIRNYSFDPGMMKIAAGATVTWINRDADVHTIKSQQGPEPFQSPALDSGGHYSFTFRHPGTYRYICSVHPFMRGVIVVQ